MNKKFDIVSLQIEAGKANPAPPVGTALGPRGINIMAFCKAFNEKTKDKGAFKIPTKISICLATKDFTFIIKEPTVSALIKDALKLKKGSQTPGLTVIETISKEKIEEIAKRKMVDLNCHSIESAISMVSGTAASMGIEVA